MQMAKMKTVSVEASLMCEKCGAKIPNLDTSELHKYLCMVGECLPLINLNMSVVSAWEIYVDHVMDAVSDRVHGCRCHCMGWPDVVEMPFLPVRIHKRLGSYNEFLLERNVNTFAYRTISFTPRDYVFFRGTFRIKANSVYRAELLEAQNNFLTRLPFWIKFSRNEN